MLVGQRMLNIDSDLGRHLVLGTYIIDTGRIPARDILSSTMPGEPRPPYEWLAQVVFAAAHKLLGLDGVVLLTSSVIAAAFMVVHVDTQGRSGAPLISLALVIWAAAGSSLHWLTRPHVFSYLFLALWLDLLERLRLGRPQSVWQLPLLMLLWANFHGGFVIGFLAWGAYAVGWAVERWRKSAPAKIGSRLLLAGAASLAASVATPDLWNNWIAIFRNSSPYVLARTAETMPMDLGSPSNWPFVGLLALGLLLAFLNGSRIKPAHGLLLLGLAALGLAIARNIPLFCLGAVPILASWSRQIMGNESRIARLDGSISRIDAGLRSGVVWPLFAISTAAMLIGFPALTSHRRIYSYDPALFPVRAVDWVQAHPMEGQAFNDINWGGYLLYRLWPEQRVFIDSQTDFYGEQFTRQYAEILAGTDGWQSQLQDHDVSWVMIIPTSPLADRLQRDAGWHVAYRDSMAVIFLRNPG